jgi:hypothetical protein
MTLTSAPGNSPQKQEETQSMTSLKTALDALDEACTCNPVPAGLTLVASFPLGGMLHSMKVCIQRFNLSWGAAHY